MKRADHRPPKYGLPPQKFPPGLEALLAGARERPPPRPAEEERPLIRDNELRYLLLELHDG